MFHPSNSTLGFTTGGVERMRIDDLGEVGIGTNNPLYTLHVNGSELVQQSMYACFDSGYGTISTYPPPGSASQFASTGTAGTSSNFSITSQSYGNGTYVISASTKIDNFQNPWNAFDTYGGNNWFSTQRYNGGNPTASAAITSNVGASNYRGEWLQVILPQPIALSNFRMSATANTPRDFYMVASANSGTTWDLLFSVVDIPQATLSNVANSNAAPTFSVNSTTLYDTYRVIVGRSYTFDIASITYLALNGSTSYVIARCGIGTSNPNELLTVSGKIYTTTQVVSTSNDSATVPSFSFLEDSNTGMFHPSNDSLGFSTGGIERMTIDDVGNVTVRSNLVVQQRFVMPSLQVVRRIGSLG
jgi:hypothetical protein